MRAGPVVIVAVAIASLPARAAADQDTKSDLGKKAAHIAAKAKSSAMAAGARERWHRKLDRRLGKPAKAIINIYNTWTREFMTVDFEPPPGRRASDPLEGLARARVNRFFRCHFTNQPTAMDVRLLAALIAAARHFDARRIDIISGFRSAKYNLILQKKGREVSRRSRHTRGHAIDFRLPGVGVKRLHAWAKRLGLGGVGYYPASGFIHIDVGRVRYWNGR